MSKSTKSKLLFEQFLYFHNVHFSRVPEGADRRPDYLINIGDTSVLFEIKELTHDDDFARVPFVVTSRKIGDHIRAKVSEAR